MTETARKNHEALFPGHKSTLQQTDPELIDVFDNFAFDEVLAYGDVDVKTRVMVILASLVAQQTLSEFKVMLGAAVNVGITPAEIKEIVYQSVPYVGIAKAFDFIHATNDFLTAQGVPLPLEGQSTTTPETRREQGLAAQKAIFGDRIERMYEQSPPDEIHIQRFLSANCFGDYYTRRGLDHKIRELLTFVMLISLGGCEPQVKGHVQGNLNVGNDRAFLLAIVTQLLPFIGYPRALNAIAAVDAILPSVK
jgi:4-carboxymuconolactone decarboxylase